MTRMGDTSNTIYDIESISIHPISISFSSDDIEFQYKTVKPNGIVVLLKNKIVLNILTDSLHELKKVATT
jgi:hypothetical protein